MKMNRISMIAAASLGVAASVASAPSAEMNIGGFDLLSPGRNHRKYRRGKGAQAKPRKRPNRLTVGKRVRRKHRRA